jgi:hypothetical protein
MRADLRGPAPAETADPTGVRIRPYAVADDEAVRLVSNASFADHWGSAPRDLDAWRSEYADAASFRPATSFVAEQAGGGLGVMTALRISTNNQISALSNRLPKPRVAQSQVPDVKAVAERHLSGIVERCDPPALTGMLDELGLSSAVIDRMGKTRTLDEPFRPRARSAAPRRRAADGVRGGSTELNRLTSPIGVIAGPGTVVPLCDGRVMTSTVTCSADADRIAGSVRTGVTMFGTLSYPCARVMP